jgi:hypothetical protein
MKHLLVCFASGSVGGLANSIVVWLSGHLGITKMLGVALAPAWSPEWLYPRIVWGGLWGLTFILPFMKSQLIGKGLLLSLLPTLYMLFFIFPQGRPGMLGLGLGMLTPALVVLFNMVWGFVAAVTIKAAK